MPTSILSTAQHRVQQMHELIADQTERVAAFRSAGDAEGAHRAATLLVVFEGTLVSAQRALANALIA